MKNISPLTLLLTLAYIFAGGCANRQAASLGAVPVVKTQVPAGEPLHDEDLKICSSCNSTSDPSDYLVSIYVVGRDGTPTDRSTNQDYVGLSADVSNLHRYFYLGEDPSTAEGLNNLLRKRRVITYRLLDVADRNGDEYWRRFSGLMSYASATKAGATALMGSSIAATFVSPVLGASLAGAGLAGDAFSTDITSGFDIEVYSALRSSVRRDVETRRRAIINKLNIRSYDEYPATSVIAEICDYAYAYTVRGAMDTLRAAARDGDARVLLTAESTRPQSVIADVVADASGDSTGTVVSWRLPPNMAGLKGVILLRTTNPVTGGLPSLTKLTGPPGNLAAVVAPTWTIVSSSETTKLVDSFHDVFPAGHVPTGKSSHFYTVVAYDSTDHYTATETARAFLIKK